MVDIKVEFVGLLWIMLPCCGFFGHCLADGFSAMPLQG